MDWTYRESRLAVIDGSLEPQALKDVQGILSHEEYSPVELGTGLNIWDLNAPLNPHVGTTVFWPELKEYREVLEEIEGVNLFPTGTPLDAVLRMARAVANEIGILGGGGQEVGFAGMIASVFRYEPGSRLIWHRDEAYLGAFSTYLSEIWSSNMGGQFAFRSPHDNDHGFGRIVEPRSNRTVVFGSEIEHCILPIPSDCQLDRVSISGFFVAHDRAEELLENYLNDLARRIQ